MQLTTVQTLQVRSPAFEDGEPIPKRHTCQGEDVSPPLSIGGVPPETKTLALAMEDPDAPDGTWVHWLVWDLPPTVTELPEDADIEALGGHEGENSWRGQGYGGPCPPSGTHHYPITVYALREELHVPVGDDVLDFETALEGKVLAWGRLTGTYTKN